MIDFERTENGYKRDLGNGKTLWLIFQLFNIKVAVGQTTHLDCYEDGY